MSNNHPAEAKKLFDQSIEENNIDLFKQAIEHGLLFNDCEKILSGIIFPICDNKRFDFLAEILKVCGNRFISMRYWFNSAIRSGCEETIDTYLSSGYRIYFSSIVKIIDNSALTKKYLPQMLESYLINCKINITKAQRIIQCFVLMISKYSTNIYTDYLLTEQNLNELVTSDTDIPLLLTQQVNTTNIQQFNNLLITLLSRNIKITNDCFDLLNSGVTSEKKYQYNLFKTSIYYFQSQNHLFIPENYFRKLPKEIVLMIDETVSLIFITDGKKHKNDQMLEII